jgi:hypothetical protein
MGAGVSVVALSDAPVGSLIWQRPPNAPVLTIVCRATFVLAPGEATLAAEQEPLAASERPYPDGSSRGVYAPCDLVPMKPAADVVLVGQAFAPGGRPVRSLVARLVVGEVDKRVEVFCDRHFDQQGVLREGTRFATMPLVYERSAGGPDTPNPVGVRPDARDMYGRLALPNLQPMGLEIATPTDPIAHVGFGPIASTWPSRRALLGAAAATQVPGEWQGPHLPADLDPSFFHAAPRDQRVQALREDERIGLENLHPTHAELSTHLPGFRPHAFVEGRGPGPQPLAMRADTLWIESTRGIAVMTWRGQVLLESTSQAVRVLVAVAPAARPLSWDDLASLERARAQRPAAAHSPLHAKGTQMMAVVPEPAAALPFARTPGQPGPAPQGTGALPFAAPGGPAPAPLPAPPKMDLGSTLPLARPAPAPIREAAPAPAPIREAAPQPAPIREVLRPPVIVESPDVPERPQTPAPPPAAIPPTAAARSPLQLLWFDPQSIPAIRKDPRLSPILDALEDLPLDGDLDEPEAAADVADVDERREIFEILARGATTGEEGITAALAAAVREDGRLVQPFVLVAGELVFPFDELEALKATISAAAPYAAADLEARGILDLAKDFLGSPGQPSAPAVAEGLATRIRETFEKRSLVPAGFLDAQAGRALVQGRHHQRRSLLGARHVRALFQVGGGQAIPVYLGPDAAAKLPAAERLRTRMLAVVHPTLDQQETHPAALRAIALGVVAGPLARR